MKAHWWSGFARVLRAPQGFFNHADTMITTVQLKFSFLILMVLGSLGGCVLAPLMEPVRQAGITESGRRGLLGERLRLFSSMLESQRFEQAADFAKEESRTEVLAALEKLGNGFRVTGTRIENRSDDRDARGSHLKVSIARFRVGRNTIEEIATEQRWEFTASGGWRLASLNFTNANG